VAILILLTGLMVVALATFAIAYRAYDHAAMGHTYARWAVDEIHATAVRIEQLEVGQQVLIEAAEAAALAE